MPHDVIDVVREEATEDAHRIGAVAPLTQGYLETPLRTITWKRAIWLTLLFCGGIFTASTLHRYADAIETIPWLLLFVPLVISTGGNSGSQSATLVITAMSTGDVLHRDWLRVVRRELLTGLFLGLLLGTIGYLAALYFTHNPRDSLIIPLTVIMVVISEMVASENGVGYFVLQAQRSFDLPEMWAGTLLIGILGYALSGVLALAERRVLRWHRASKASALAS